MVECMLSICDVLGQPLKVPSSPLKKKKLVRNKIFNSDQSDKQIFQLSIFCANSYSSPIVHPLGEHFGGHLFCSNEATLSFVTQTAGWWWQQWWLSWHYLLVCMKLSCMFSLTVSWNVPSFSQVLSPFASTFQPRMYDLGTSVTYRDSFLQKHVSYSSLLTVCLWWE